MLSTWFYATLIMHCSRSADPTDNSSGQNVAKTLSAKRIPLEQALLQNCGPAFQPTAVLELCSMKIMNLWTIFFTVLFLWFSHWYSLKENVPECHGLSNEKLICLILVHCHHHRKVPAETQSEHHAWLCQALILFGVYGTSKFVWGRPCDAFSRLKKFC